MKTSLSNKSTEEKYINYKHWLFLIFALIFLYLSFKIGSPIFGSDEYAYFISSKYFDKIIKVYELDPGLQRVSNLLYFKLTNMWIGINKSGLGVSIRWLHTVEYMGAVILLNIAFKNILSVRSLFFASLLALILPGSIYILAVMPEVEIIFTTSCLAYVLIVIFPKKPNLAAGVAGILVGASLLIKPHAVAMLMAAILMMLTAGYIGVLQDRNNRPARMVIIMVLSCYITIVVLWHMCDQVWNFNPSAPLGLKFYGQYLNSNIHDIGIAEKLWRAAQYGVVHAIVLSLIFLPAILWMIRRLKRRLAERSIGHDENLSDIQEIYASLFIMSMLIMNVVMVSWFTSGAAAISDGESMRLHGRYLGSTIILLPFLYLKAVDHIDDRDYKIYAISILALLVLTYTYVLNAYKIYPWDYPMLFAFYLDNNGYAWNYAGVYIWLSYILLVVLTLLWTIGFIYKKMQSKICYVHVVIISIFGCIQTFNWATAHTASNRGVVEESHAISTLLGSNQFGKGVLVSEERYGRTSYILFGLNNSPKVLIRKNGDDITEDDVQGADWVLMDGTYKAKFSYTDSVSFESFKLYPLKTEITVQQKVKSFLKSGFGLAINIGDGYFSPHYLIGFGKQEGWGAWTDTNLSEVELPVQLSGKIKVKLFAWTLKENQSKFLQVSVGEETRKIEISNTAREYEIEFDVKKATDRLLMNFAIFHPEESHRVMGIAVARITMDKE